jgi:hypothetical protein
VATETATTLNIKEYKNSIKFHEDRTNIETEILHFDLNLDPDSETDRTGWQAIREIMNNEFTPAILYTAHAEEILPTDIKDLYIQKVPKDGGNRDQLRSAIKKSIEIRKRYSQEKIRILNEFKKISLGSFKTLLPYPGTTDFDESIITHMAVARVISVLKNIPPPGCDKIPAETIFLIPPLDVEGEENCVLQGDLLKETDNGSDSIFLVSSPSCDLYQKIPRKRNVDKVLLLHCFRSKEEYDRKNPHRDPISKTKFGSYETSGACHLIKCPKFLSESGFLLIVFKNYKTLEFSQLQEKIGSSIIRIATIATPYAENIQNLFIADLSRVGIPDIEKDETQWRNGFFDYHAAPPRQL